MRCPSSCSKPTHPPVPLTHTVTPTLFLTLSRPCSISRTVSWIFNLSFPVSTFPLRPYTRSSLVLKRKSFLAFSANLLKAVILFSTPSFFPLPIYLLFFPLPLSYLSSSSPNSPSLLSPLSSSTHSPLVFLFSLLHSIPLCSLSILFFPSFITCHLLFHQL